MVRGSAVVEHRVHNPKVAGSIPAPATSFEARRAEKKTAETMAQSFRRMARHAKAEIESLHDDVKVFEKAAEEYEAKARAIIVPAE